MSIDTAVGEGAVDPEAVRDELRRMLRAGQVLTDAASLDAYAHDDAEWAPFEPPVGLLKLPGARAELGERVIDLHVAVKRALDPFGTLNPGKAYPA